MVSESGTYEVECRDGREISPFVDYTDDLGLVEFKCPSCGISIAAKDLVKEGGSTCDGCRRVVRLHITADSGIPGWRNIPRGTEEMYR